MTTNDIQNTTQQHKPIKHYIETQRFSKTNLQNTTQQHKDLATQTYKTLHRNTKIQQHKPHLQQHILNITDTHVFPIDGERKYKKNRTYMNCELVKYGYESEQMKGQIHAML